MICGQLPLSGALGLALAVLKEYRPVVVGGFLRDFFHSVPHKDVDIFFCDPVSEAFAVEDLLNLGLAASVRTVLGGSAECAKDRNISGITEAVLTDGTLLQLIYPLKLTTPQHLVDSVDFGLCRIGWSFETGLIITDAYKVDALARQFTLLIDNPERRQRALSRFERLKEKYPDFRLVLPSEAVPT